MGNRSWSRFALVAAVAAGVALLLLRWVGTGSLWTAPLPDDDEPFFPSYAALAGSSLGLDRFNADSGVEYRVVIDQGIRRTADVSDIYVDVRTEELHAGMAPAVLPTLERRLRGIGGEARGLWQRHRRIFDAPTRSTPVSEGILAQRTPQVMVPLISEDDPTRRTLEPVLLTLKTLIEARTDVPVVGVATRRGPWLQDFLIPFADGSLGVPPHLDTEEFHATIRSVHERARDFMIGGKAWTMGSVIDTPFRHLRGQGYRFRQLRSFVEGGNIVFAQAADGPVRAIVGINTVKLTQTAYGLTARDARRLIADDFDLAPRDVIVIPQPDYHIDLYLRAALPGAVFLASPEDGEQMLERLMVDAATSQGTPAYAALETQRRRVKRSNSSRFGYVLERRLERIRSILEDAGFQVIAYPSLYYSYFYTGEYSKADGRIASSDGATFYNHINTMNGRYVTASDGRVLSLVLSSGFPEIDRYIENFEIRHGVDEIFFLGKRLAAPEFQGNKVLMMAAGVGCLTNL